MTVRIFLFMLGMLAASTKAQQFKELDWLDLLPDEEREALMNPPAIDHLFEDLGIQQDSLLRNDAAAQSLGDEKFQSALISTNVRSELDQQDVRLPGFIVPLEYNDEQKVTEFFLVPYFGACIHVPPPPPNQIIYVSYPAGFELESIWDPFFIDGKLSTELTSNEVAISAYSIEAAAIVPYQ